MSEETRVEVAALAAEKSPQAKAMKRMKIQEYALPAVVIALFIVGSILKPDTFPTQNNLLNVLTQASVTGIIAIGMTFVIATAGIDLSVGSILAVSAIVGGQFVDDGSTTFIAVTLLAGLCFGAFNGILIARLRIVAFIVTLAMMGIARGISLQLSGQTPITLFKLTTVTDIGSERFLAVGSFLGIPIPAVFFIAVSILGWVLLNRTRWGRYVVAVGGNREAARIAGIRVRQIIFSVYALIGLLTGLAAVLQSGRLASASPVVGTGYELDAIAAVVVGGTSLSGGRASMVGTVFGVITFALVFNLLTLLNLSSNYQQIVKGAIILAAVAVQRRDG